MVIKANIASDLYGSKSFYKVSNLTDKVVKAAPVAKGNGIVQLVKKNPGVAIAAGAVVAVGGGVAYLAHHVKQKKMTKQEECVADFQKALKAYLKAATEYTIQKRVAPQLTRVGGVKDNQR